MIPFGPFHPDRAGLNTPVARRAENCIPLVGGGYGPLRGPVALTDSLTGACEGAATVFDDVGDVHVFAGDTTKLYKLGADQLWDDVTRTSGGAYAAGSGEPWRFAASGALIIGCTIGDVPQKFELNVSTNFAALGGSPPQSRFIATVRDFVVLGGILNNERRVQWSGLALPEVWTPGTSSSDYQDFQDGGPIRGLIGGEVGYVMQAERVTRMTFIPDSDAIFQFDQIEGGRGLAVPGSLVRFGQLAFYYGDDGFYRMDLGSGAAQPIGVGKWTRWFKDELKSINQPMIAGVDPRNRLIVWGFVSKAATGSTPDKLLLYDWALDEATCADVSATAIARLLTTGVTLDTMNAFGNMETLLFSLDSPVWQGGEALLGIFSADKTLAYLTGETLEAVWESSDKQTASRQYINGVRPLIDTTSATVALAAREAQGETVAFDTAEALADTGVSPQHTSGHLIRAQCTAPAGAAWSKMEGMLDQQVGQGMR